MSGGKIWIPISESASLMPLTFRSTRRPSPIPRTPPKTPIIRPLRRKRESAPPVLGFVDGGHVDFVIALRVLGLPGDLVRLLREEHDLDGLAHVVRHA